MRSDRQMKANIGISFDDWRQLSLLFAQVHQDIYGVSPGNKFKHLKTPPFENGRRGGIFCFISLMLRVT